MCVNKACYVCTEPWSVTVHSCRSIDTPQTPHCMALHRVTLQVREDQPYRLAVSSFVQNPENYIEVIKCALLQFCRPAVAAAVVFGHKPGKDARRIEQTIALHNAHHCTSLTCVMG